MKKGEISIVTIRLSPPLFSDNERGGGEILIQLDKNQSLFDIIMRGGFLIVYI
jgi:hypothetical protein